MQYLGSVTTTNHGGEEVISAALKTIKLRKDASPKDILLIISAEGVDLEAANAEGVGTGKVGVGQAKGEGGGWKVAFAIRLTDFCCCFARKQITKNIPIRQISFSASDKKNKKVFAFISSDPKTSITMCHVFQCRSKVGGCCRECCRECHPLYVVLRN